MISSQVDDKLFGMAMEMKKTFDDDRNTPLDMLYHSRITRISTADQGVSQSLIYKLSQQSRISILSKLPREFLD